MAFGTSTQLGLDLPPEPNTADAEDSREPSLTLLPVIESGRAVFVRNLKDFLLFRDWPHPLDRRTYEGWHTAYVFTGPSWTRIRESWWGHALIAAATFAVCTSPFLLQTPVRVVSPFEHAHIQYYPVSEYLPPINSAAPRPHTNKSADPVYAKQEIISVRPGADNHTQTIITPPKMKLQHDVALPNMAVWTADPVAPTVASPSVQPKMVFPVAAPVEPPPDVATLRDRRSVNLQNSAVEPIANDQSLRRAGQLNISSLRPDVVPPAPALPVQAQRAAAVAVAQVVPPVASLAGVKRGELSSEALRPQVVPPQASAPALAQRSSAHGVLQPQVVPPQPSVSNAPGRSGAATGQIIALSVRPTDVHGPISIPAGNRNGEFASGPNGNPNASGQPNSSPNAKPPGTGAGNGAEKDNGPAGVYVGAPPPGANQAPVVASKPQLAPDAPKEMAKLQFPKMHATVADLARTTRPSEINPADRSPLADKVFAGKRYYSLTLNMPNLNSATGSWVVRFAELNERHDGVPVVAPVATSKLDPVYPQELAREHVEGTVTLYAVIGHDGTVREIRVLKSLDKSLDYSAMRALAGWRFVPGTKNGSAVDLEAIVDIPFHLKTLNF
jgi:TonB family protein